MGFGIGIDSATHLGNPQFHAVVDEDWKGKAELLTVEGTGRFPNHDRLEASVRISEGDQESSSLRSPFHGKDRLCPMSKYSFSGSTTPPCGSMSPVARESCHCLELVGS